MDDVLDGVVAELVGRAVGDAALDAAAGQPHREALDVVVAAVALGHRRAAELAAPDDERVVEHAALLQVLDQRRRRPGRPPRALIAMSPLMPAVMVPVAVVELDEAHAALGQAAGQQAVGRERAVARPRCRTASSTLAGSLARVHQLGHARLHAERHLVLRDRVAISGSSTQSGCACRLSALHRVDHVALLRVASTPGGVAQVEHRVALASGSGRPGSGWAGSRCATAARRSAASGRRGPCEVSTTKPGRSSASLPRP